MRYSLSTNLADHCQCNGHGTASQGTKEQQILENNILNINDSMAILFENNQENKKEEAKMLQRKEISLQRKCLRP